MKHGLVLAFFLGSILVGGNALAQQPPPDTTAQCQNLLDAYGELLISAKQAKLTSDIQAGLVAVCRKLIELEKPKPTPEPTPEVK